MSVITLLLILSLQSSKVFSIWPPSYDVDLEENEEFVISDVLTDDDTADVYEAEDELIKNSQLKSINYKENKDKYYRLHRILSQSAKKDESFGKKKKLIQESNYENEDSQPWVANLVDKNGNQILGETVYYYNESAKNSVKNKIDRKREEILDVINITNAKNEQYDYVHMKNDYDQAVSQAEQSNNTLNYTEVKEEETLKDSVKDVVDFKKKTNCTKEESKGIGIAAAKCLYKDMKTPKSEGKIRKLFEKVLRITLIWFCVYLIIAIPCWCQRGWCCCCFFCRCCRPLERLDEAKKFLMDNPEGVYHTDDGEEITYTPTVYEQYMQKDLERTLMNL